MIYLSLTVANDQYEESRYLFGQLPVVDAFIAWSLSGEDPAAADTGIDYTWRKHFHLYSLLVAILLILVFFVIRKVGSGRWTTKT